MARQALGRGLEALIPSKENEETVVNIDVKNILRNPHQPRKDFIPEKLEELVSSVKIHGIIQPIIVRKKGDQFEVIAGERRLRAAENAGLEKIPAIVRTATDESSLEVALIENIQRENLNPIEEAHAYAELINEFGLSQEEVSEKVGKNRSTITNTLRLLKLPEEIKIWIKEGKLSTGHAKALLSLDSVSSQINVAENIVHKGLSVREAEEIVNNVKQKDVFKKKREHVPQDPYLFDIEEKMKDYFSTMVRIKHKGKKGSIVIDYYSRDDLQRILETLDLTR